MTNEPIPIPLKGVLQNYAWGGYDYLAHLLGINNNKRLPMAELWIGTHPKGPAEVIGSDTTLDRLILRQPGLLSGNDSITGSEQKGLSFLLKVLDVREMLSIQVHPNKSSAEIGYAHEEKNGPARTAPTRNYRDDNHKPELGVAISDFYLVHGFLSAAVIEKTCQSITGWDKLIPILRKQGVSGLYEYIMSADQSVVDDLLHPLTQSLKNRSLVDRSHPDFWASRAVDIYSDNGHHDRGIFSLYWMNIVHLRPGEGIFQDAGVPHAYLEGTCVELMANSDNVLRGGLTPKHIDVAELLKHTNCNSVTPEILRPQSQVRTEWDRFITPVSDFELLVTTQKKGSLLSVNATQCPAIIFMLEGELADLQSEFQLNNKQRSAFLPAGCELTMEVLQDANVFLASVPSRFNL